MTEEQKALQSAIDGREGREEEGAWMPNVRPDGSVIIKPRDEQSWRTWVCQQMATLISRTNRLEEAACEAGWCDCGWLKTPSVEPAERPEDADTAPEPVGTTPQGGLQSAIDGREGAEGVWPDFVAPAMYESPAEGWIDPALPDFRRIWEIARSAGYTVGLHGSMKRDVDLIAVPWVTGALSAEELIARLCEGLNAKQIGEPETKPYGRIAVTLQLQDKYAKHIDLSITSRDDSEQILAAIPKASPPPAGRRPGRDAIEAAARAFDQAMADHGYQQRASFDTMPEGTKEALLNSIRSAITAYLTAEPSDGWRPITSGPDESVAPWDGEPVLILTDHRPEYRSRVHRAIWTDAISGHGIHGWAVEDCKHGPYALRGYMNVTAWQPLPAPPPPAAGAMEEEG